MVGRSLSAQDTQEKTKTRAHRGAQDISNTRFKVTAYDFECIAMLRNACKRLSLRRTRYDTQTCEVDVSGEAKFSASIAERQVLAKQSESGRLTDK